jgi:hypothetical protein
VRPSTASGVASAAARTSLLNMFNSMMKVSWSRTSVRLRRSLLTALNFVMAISRAAMSQREISLPSAL